MLIKILYRFFMFVPCHRIPDRCYIIKGKPMPICSRCLSMLIGYLFVPFLFFINTPFWVGLLFQIPMLVDGITQKKRWRTSNNYLRSITGLLSGIGLSILIVEAVRFLTGSL